MNVANQDGSTYVYIYGSRHDTNYHVKRNQGKRHRLHVRDLSVVRLNSDG